MSQIKRKFGATNYTVQQFREDMHLLWANAKQFNADGSWVFDAAADMQEYFDEMWDKEYPLLHPDEGTSNGNGQAVNKALGSVQAQAQGDGGDSPAASGTSTPMFKPAAAPKIKLNLGGAKKKAAPVPAPGSEDSDDSDGDDY